MSAASEIRQTCPECQGTIVIRNRELIGKKITCPKCKKAVLVQDTSAPKKAAKPANAPRDEDETPKPKKGKKGKKSADQSQVRLLIYIGAGLLVVAGVVLVIFLVLSGGSGEGNKQGPGEADGGGGAARQNIRANPNAPVGVPEANQPGGGQAGGGAGSPLPGKPDELLKQLLTAQGPEVQKIRSQLARMLHTAQPQQRQELIKLLREKALELAKKDEDPAPILRVLELAMSGVRVNVELRRELGEVVSAIRRTRIVRLGNWRAHATNLLPNETQIFLHLPVERLLKSFAQQVLFDQVGFQPQDFEQQLGVELGQISDLVVAGLPTRQQCMIIVTSKTPMTWERVQSALRVQPDSRQTRAGKEYYLGRTRFLNELLGGRFPLASLAEKAAVHLGADRKTLVIAHEELLAAWLEKPPTMQWRVAGTESSGEAGAPIADFATFLTLPRDFRLLVDRIDREGPYSLLYGEWRTQKQSRDLLAGLKAWLQWLPTEFSFATRELVQADGIAFALVQLPEAPIAVSLALHAPEVAVAERIKNTFLRVNLPAIRQTIAKALDSNVLVHDVDKEALAETGGQPGDTSNVPMGEGGLPGVVAGGGGSAPMGQPMPPGPPPGAVGGGSAPGDSDVGPGGGPKRVQPNLGGGGGSSAPGGPAGIKPIPPQVGGGPGAGTGAAGPGGPAPVKPNLGGAGSAPAGAPRTEGEPVAPLSGQGGAAAPAETVTIDPDKPTLSIYVQQADEYVQVGLALTQPTKPLVQTLEEQLLYARGEMQLHSRGFRIHELARAGANYPNQHARAFPPGALTARDEAFGTRGNLPLEYRISFLRELLPYFDDDRYRQLYTQIDPAKPWHDPQNLKAARVLVPQFLHPAAPPYYGPAMAEGREVRLALTHFVGMAGVGPDAPFYRKDDPRAGIFGDPAYRPPTTLDDIRDGTSNTILMIQVDSRLAGPWIQGGGSTMRGTSLSGTDVGRPYGFLAPPHNGQPGTFVVMADGSVRFLTRNISPEIFKALCTMAGGENLPALDSVAPRIESLPETPASFKPLEKTKPPQKEPTVSRRDPWTADPALTARLAEETRVGPFTFRPPAGYKAEQAKPGDRGETVAHWYGPPHEEVGVAPALMVSVTPLDLNLAGQPIETIVQTMVARIPSDGGRWDFDTANMQRGLINGRLFVRVAGRLIAKQGEQLRGYYYQHTDGQLGLGILILDHPSHAETTLPLLETSVATFRKP